MTVKLTIFCVSEGYPEKENQQILIVTIYQIYTVYIVYII